MQAVQQTKRRVMSVRLPEGRYEKLLTLQRSHSKDQLRTVSCNEIICAMIRDYTAQGAPKLSLTAEAQRSSKRRVLSVRMPEKLYERLLRLQRSHSKDQLRTVSYNELIRAMIRDYTTNGAPKLDVPSPTKRKKSR